MDEAVREVAVMLAYPVPVLGRHRIGIASDVTDYDNLVRHPTDDDASKGAPIFLDRMPATKGRAICVASVPGSPGERLFGTHGIGRERLSMTIEVRGHGADGGKDDESKDYEWAKTTAVRAGHLVACAQTARLPEDWPRDVNGNFDESIWHDTNDNVVVPDSGRTQYGETELSPVYLARREQNGSPVYLARVRLVRVP